MPYGKVREAGTQLTVAERSLIHDALTTTLPIDALSKRELQVAGKIMEGLSNKAIANKLFISERTVKFHCANIYKKLNIRSRSALIASCFRSIYQPAQQPNG